VPLSDPFLFWFESFGMKLDLESWMGDLGELDIAFILRLIYYLLSKS
jgi:hypothetical protein